MFSSKFSFILIITFVLSFTVQGQPRCGLTPTILNINDSHNSVVNLINTHGDDIKNDIQKIKSSRGYPILNCTDFDGVCEFPKNRFLATNEQNKYFIIDSNLRIIINASDTIIAIERSTSNSDKNNFDVACKSREYRGTKQIHYQSSVNGFTTLYNYNGKKITEIPFKGILLKDDFDPKYNNSFWVTFQFSKDQPGLIKNGLIDSHGNEILPLTSIKSRKIHFYSINQESIWILKTDSTGQLFNAKTKEILLTYNYGESSIGNYDLLIYQIDGKYGIFHPERGILVRPKYLDIIGSDIEEDTFILRKKNRSKTWIVPGKLKRTE